MLVVSVVLLTAGGLADMVSAAIRQTILLTASDDDVRGRLQGVFIGGGGVLVVLGIVTVALAAPSFRR